MLVYLLFVFEIYFKTVEAATASQWLSWLSETVKVGDYSKSIRVIDVCDGMYLRGYV